MGELLPVELKSLCHQHLPEENNFVADGKVCP